MDRARKSAEPRASPPPDQTARVVSAKLEGIKSLKSSSLEGIKFLPASSLAVIRPMVCHGNALWHYAKADATLQPHAVKAGAIRRPPAPRLWRQAARHGSIGLVRADYASTTISC
jgi:hypothetical protein